LCIGNVVPSACTLNYLRDYLRGGSLPQPGIVCGEDCNVFDGSCLRAESSKAIIFGYRICPMTYVIMKYEMLGEWQSQRTEKMVLQKTILAAGTRSNRSTITLHKKNKYIPSHHPFSFCLSILSTILVRESPPQH
jgi:hypothetical protein